MTKSPLTKLTSHKYGSQKLYAYLAASPQLSQWSSELERLHVLIPCVVAGLTRRFRILLGAIVSHRERDTYLHTGRGMQECQHSRRGRGGDVSIQQMALDGNNGSTKG